MTASFELDAGDILEILWRAGDRVLVRLVRHSGTVTGFVSAAELEAAGYDVIASRETTERNN